MSSILTDTKKNIGFNEDDTSFDLDITTHINSAFFTLFQLGIGPAAGFSIEDDSDEWDDFLAEGPYLNAVKQYIYLKTRIVFDPPATSFSLEAMKNQIAEQEGRLSIQREWLLDPVDPMVAEEEEESDD